MGEDTQQHSSRQSPELKLKSDKIWHGAGPDRSLRSQVGWQHRIRILGCHASEVLQMLARAFSVSFISVGVTLFGVKQALGLRLAKVEGPSMSPTLNPQPPLDKPPPKFTVSDIVIVRQTTDLSEGSIVCLEHPRVSGAFLVKRLKVINDKEETCWITSDGGGGGKYLDSSVLGPVPLKKIVGTATHIVLPPWRFTRL